MTQYPTLTDVQAAAARIKPYVHRTPVLTCTSLNDLVGAVLFLCSHLSDMVVGHVLMVDGGWTIQ